MADNYERYRFQDFPWLDKEFEQAMEFLKDEKERELGVYLQNRQVDPEKLDALLQLASTNGFLNALMLDQNQIGDEGCMLLKEYLSSDKKLKYLFLENNGITDKGVQILIEGLKNNNTLKSLWLGRNQITDDGVEAFCDYLIENQVVKEFSVGGINMTDDGAFCVAKALNTNDQIVSVHLLDNQVDYDGARLLAEVASTHASCNTVEINGKMKASDFSTLMGQLAEEERRAAFEEALRNGEEGPWLRSKIMVVGQGRAGKTATVRSLLNIPFDENLQSTIGADISTSTTKKSAGNKWEKDLDTGDKKVDLAVDAASRLAVLKMRKKKNEQATAFQKKSLQEMREYFKGIKEEEQRKIQKLKESGNNVIPKDMQEEINQKYNATLVTNKNAHLEDIAFTIWDYGGQKVFYTLHHLFLTEYGLYILVFDMRDVVVPNAPRSPDGYRMKKEKQKESREYLEFWLNSVHMHASSAPIIIVGTFLDVVSTADEILEVNQFVTDVLGKRFNSVVVKNGALCFFPLSNKESQKEITKLARQTGGKGAQGISNVDTIRDTIEEVARQQPFVNQHLSLKWIKCLDNMLSADSDIIYYKDVISIAAKCGISQPAEVDNLLNFFHELGMIVHLSSTQHLREIVTIKPQWLITELAKVIRDKTLHKFDQADLKRKGLTEFYRLVTQEAILTRDWLEFLWPKARIEFLIDLMKRTMLISDWKFGEFSRESAFLVPSLIDKENSDMKEEAARLLVQFKEKETDDVEKEIKALEKEGFFSEALKGDGLKMKGGLLAMAKNFRGLAGRRKKIKDAESDSLGEENGDPELDEVDQTGLPSTQVVGEKDDEDGEEEEQPLKGWYDKSEDANCIVFDFTKSFLPNGVFQRLLCLCILKCTADNVEAKKPDLWKSSAVIHMGGGQQYRLFQHNKQILCQVKKNKLESYKVLLSMIEKLKADVMGAGLEWDAYLEIIDEKDKNEEEEVFHHFVPFKEARDAEMAPWFHEPKHDEEEEIIHRRIGIELEDFLADIANF